MIFRQGASIRGGSFARPRTPAKKRAELLAVIHSILKLKWLFVMCTHRRICYVAGKDSHNATGGAVTRLKVLLTYPILINTTSSDNRKSARRRISNVQVRRRK